MNLGIAFQLVDDALDYAADQATLGKTVGDDFREGKITLPVLLAYAAGDATERAFWRRTIEASEQAEADLEHALRLMAAARCDRRRHWRAPRLRRRPPRRRWRISRTAGCGRRWPMSPTTRSAGRDSPPGRVIPTRIMADVRPICHCEAQSAEAISL